MAIRGTFESGIVPTDVMKNATARAQFADGEKPTVARLGLLWPFASARPKLRDPKRGMCEAHPMW